MVKLNANNLLTFFPVSITAIMCASCAMFAGPMDKNIIGKSGPDGPPFARNIHRRLEMESFFRPTLQREMKNPAAVEVFTKSMGVSEDVLGDYQGAEQANRTTLEIEPKQHYLLQGRCEMVIENFSKALALDGGHRRYRNNLGLAYTTSGDTLTAFEVLKKNSDEGAAHLCMARLSYRMGYYEEAASHFAQAAALKPTDALIDKGRSASVNMAGIYARSSNNTALNISPIVIHDDRSAMASSDDGELSTIPPGKIKQIKLTAINLADLPSTNINSSYKDMTANYKKEAEAMPAKTTGLKNAEIVLQAKQKPGSRNLRTRIEVANGNGVRHMASQVGGYLQRKGYLLTHISNADNFKYTETSITYVKGYKEEACRMSEEIPGQHNIKEVDKIQNRNAHISVLIGNDLKRYSAFFEG